MQPYTKQVGVNQIFEFLCEGQLKGSQRCLSLRPAGGLSPDATGVLLLACRQSCRNL